ncbi:MAG: pectate lyase [Bacteroidota bacterium]|nr:pectate lyase [Bacteroidota bacterium]
MDTIESSFLRLKKYCEEECFRGWDPFDGLNSRIFQGLPLRNSRLARLVWIQLFKKSPVNFRKLALVPKDYNNKGLGLFLLGYCNLYKIEQKEEYLNKINFLALKLIENKNSKFAGACWGYNFDWQARAFFQPKNYPTVVATNFIANALLNAYEITQNEVYKTTACSAAEFVYSDLNRTTDDDGDFCFSYSPLDNTQIFNASLLGSQLLARVYSMDKNEVYKEAALKSVRYCCKRQQENGAWAYGTLPFHQWIDNFHTGYNLVCLADFANYTDIESFNVNIEKGFTYYISTFFTDNGESKYYNNKLYPIDIHAPAQLVITLSKLSKFKENLNLVSNVLSWTVKNMQHSDGYFYYQYKPRYLCRIPYIRWAQAWMFYALSEYKKLNKTNKNGL